MVGPIIVLIVLSCVSNVLMLTGPIFMMQVYDRVLGSQSVPTLVALTVIVAVLFGFFGLIDAMRSRIVLRVGDVVDGRIRTRLFRAGVRARASSSASSDPTSDADALRQFTSSSAILSFLDLPWMPVYVAIVFVLHSGLGWMAVGGVAVVAMLMVLNELVTRKPALALHDAEHQRRARTDDAYLNAEPALAMGMLRPLQDRWSASVRDLRAIQAMVSDRGSAVAATSKASRFLLQSLVLALGAYYVIVGELSAGAIIAGSVITSRALAPVEQVVAHWRTFLTARRAYTRIRAVYDLPDLAPRATRLPRPASTLEVTDITVLAPGRAEIILRGINFQLRAGDALAVIGPSAAGKTTLARCLVGLWPCTAGTVRLDGAELSHYDPDDLGRAIGYLPQQIGLLDGTVAENISRFEPAPDPTDVINTARTAGVHAMVLALPDGYDTPVGPQGGVLSAGQRQRIGLARAVFGHPFLIVLDEPNSNLDPDGDRALTEAIRTLRQAGSIVIVNAHRPSALAATTHVLTLRAGRQVAFGPKDEVLTQFRSQAASGAK